LPGNGFLFTENLKRNSLL